ncbi:Electron transport complex protein rnfC [Thiorhodococcus drewsii AZ1]|uniref:Ion-translocating oxidoreductase complex subunit C n=1 Tax=Thiorhodococcus drewsii AZ1 TaxID=765913 RepID=G2E3C9_9GAMM|nr:electron transport complex subunit RsxC [Thiorhodococcus drewsii]EGV30318.1 Electron transport complex protein rnfC [Thiorhodococcus drewsii AZ1]
MAVAHSLIANRRLWTFHGGIHIPDEKSLSNGAPIAPIALPSRLVVPLQQHIGAPARVIVAVGERVLKGQMIAEPTGLVSAPVHAPSSGTLVAIESHPIPHPSGLMAPCAIIETDGEDAWAELPPPMTDYPQLDPELIRERIRWAGVVGMGGASFPTSVKLSPGTDRHIHTLIINGAECEPYISCDDRLMRERSGHIFEGVRIMHHLLGVKQVLIGIEDNKPEAIEEMRLALAETDMHTYTEIVPIPTLYPSGGEKQLIRILTGKEVPTKGIPAQVGIVCQNVGTAAAVADAVLEGRPLVSRVVTVTGRAIANPRNLEVPIGTPASDLIAHCGGYRETPRKLVCGGPMMGFALRDADTPITKATNCVLALTPEESPAPGPALACIRCGRCAQACPANLLPQQMYWHARAKDLDRVQDYNLFDCIECGCCAQVCPSHIPLVQYYRYAKTEIWSREQEKRKSEQARARHAAKQARLERQEQERQAKLRKQKEALAAKAKAQAKPETAAKQQASAASPTETANDS